jgi:hypothetical protein
MKKTTLAAVALLATSMAFAQQKKEKQAPPPPPPPPVVSATQIQPPPPPAPEKPNKEYDAFLKKYPEVKSIAWANDAVRIRLKSGKDEVYDMKNPADVKKLKDTYGELPTPPPPPPPPKPLKAKTQS